MRVGVAGVMLERGKGELRKILRKLRGCVYGGARNCPPTFPRRRGVRGEMGELVLDGFLTNVNTLAAAWSLVPAD